MRNLVCFVLLSFFCGSTFASTKHSISGTITDNSTGESLIGASVIVTELVGTGATTNAYGYYSLTLPEGKYTLMVSYLGYKTISTTVSFTENKQISFKLEPETRQLNDVEIIALRKNHNITSTEMGAEKLEIKEISKIPVLFGEADIMKTLKLTPGIKSVGEGSGGMYVRGGNNSQNLILLDEATVYNADHLLGFFSTFNSDAIKDIQMFKGTAPSEYGGRISSVLDVKMNDGNNQKYHVGGGIGLISSRLNIEGPIVEDKSSFLITGRRTYADLFLKLSTDELINNNQLYFYDLNAKLNYKINNKNRLFLSGYFGRDVFEFQDRFGINWGNSTGTIRWNHIWNERLFSNTSIIYSDFDYNVDIMQDAGFSLTSMIKNWNLKHEFQFFSNNKNTVSFGLSSIYQTIIPGQLELSEDSDILPLVLQKKHASDNAIYANHVWKPSYNLNINYGVRLSAYYLLGPGEFYTYKNGEVNSTTTYGKGEIVQNYVNIEPRINIAWILNDQSSLKTSYTRNTQNLHLVSNSTSSMPTDIWISSSNNVKPEISDQLSLGYFLNFSKDKYQFSSEIYYRWMQNQIDLKNGADINANDKIEGELLFGVGRAYGLELLLKKKTGKITGWIGYTYSTSERRIDGVNNDKWYPAKQDIKHDVSVVGIYELNKKWSVSASWVYNTGNAVTFPSGKYIINGNVQYYYTERNGYRMPDYHRLDIGATRSLKKTKQFESSLNFSVYNAYGHKNPFSIDFQQDENDPSKTVAVKTYLFTYVPSITYNFKF
jgi:hypothetical protein